MLQVGLQVRRESLENSVRRQSIALQKARETAERALATQRVTVEKKRLEHERNARKLERLRADRELLDVRAPIDGIVYHGRATRGKWTALATATEKLRRGSSVARGDIVMTVVPDVALRLRLDLPEAHVHHVRPGLEGSASPAAFPDAELPAAVESVSRVPVAPGIFDAVVELEGSEHLERLVAGMACTVELVPYSSGDALTVPNGAIHEESDVTVVWLQGRDGGAPVKRRVRTGKTDGTRTEILDGLEEGDEVLLEKPAS